MGEARDLSVTLLHSSSTSQLSRKDHVRLGVYKRLGWWTILVLPLGVLILLAFFAFLAFLWLADETNHLWQHIVVSGWVARSITLSALVVRWVTAAQAAIATFMMAALLLQYHLTPLASAPAVSIARFSNTGPASLLLDLPRGRRLSIRSICAWVVVVALVAISIAVQFTSTALLSDIGRSTIAVNKLITDAAFGSSYDNSIGYLDSWSSSPCHSLSSRYLRHASRPTTFPAFAEFTMPTTGEAGTIDTGISIRGFMPISDKTVRESSLGYMGNATLVGTRVACLRPEVSDVQISLGFQNKSLEHGPEWPLEP
ncbi:hypothetical protein QBC44DRAFT_310975 [Cladorrhinum sp. PSN332]|nr:hypothetical protein QBC44DRAFT_310975 [Cladorrhinum sp. PSN332]